MMQGNCISSKTFRARKHRRNLKTQRDHFRPSIQALEDRLLMAANVVGYKFLDINGDGIRNTNIIQGNRPDVVFVVDVSSSTAVGAGAAFVGSPVGDVNSDGVANTILDAELAGFRALAQQLVDQGLGADADIGIVLFGGNAVQLDMDSAVAGDQLTIPAGRDSNANTIPDVVELLSLIRHGGQGISASVNGATTNYEAALQTTIQFFNTLGTAPGNGNMVFLTDGQPNDPSTSTAVYGDEVATLRASGVNLRAYGAGGTSSVPPLQVIDSSAVRFDSTDELLAAFGGLQGSKTVFTEPGIAGVKIWLDIDRDGLFDADEPFTFSVPDNPATPENELGNYIITGVPNGTYDVHEDVPVGMIQTAPFTGFGTITITGNFDYRVNFGNRPGEISGTKWFDSNGNGLRDQLIVGDTPTVVFVIDVSGSTSDTFQGTINVGDLNGDGQPNTILDSEIAGFIALNQSLINGGFGAVGTVSIVAFESSAISLDLDPVTPGIQIATNPLADRDNNGVRDVDQALKSLSYLGGTDYELALGQALNVFTALNTPSSQANLIFLSDGAPNIAGAHADEVAALHAIGVNNLRAFGAGQGASLPELQIIDPQAAIFNSPDELISLFDGSNGSGSSGSTFSESGLAGVTIYLDLNDNGVKDPGEPSTVTAVDNPATTIDETGTYSFSNLSPGSYIVREITPPNLFQTYPAQNTGHTVLLGLNYVARAVNIDFGNAPPGEISGTKYYDANRNGVFDFGDQTLSGVTIYVDLNLNGQFEVGEPSQVTDRSGNYAFSFFAPGNYTVSEVLNTNCNWVASFPPQGYNVQVTGGGHTRNINFFNYLDTYTKVVGTTLNVCTPDSDDLVGIFQNSNGLYVQVNDTFATFDIFAFDLISVDTAGGDDKITVQGGIIPTEMFGGWGDDVLTSSSGNDRLVGGFGDDTLVGGAGTDTYVMGELDVSPELDVIVAGNGPDVLDFSGSPVPVNVDLSNPTQLATQGSRTIVSAPTTVSFITDVIGSNFSDTIVGNLLSNVLQGLGGNDLLTGGGGDDTLLGGQNNDTYVFDADNALGIDFVSDPAGLDTLDFSQTTTRGVSINLSLNTQQFINAGLRLTIDLGSIDAILGTSQNDLLVGSQGPNTLQGNGGDDSLYGVGGSDLLIGGLGNDVYFFDTDGALGSDTIDESAGGIDTLNFSGTTTIAVKANLATATTQVVNANLSLTLGSGSTVENIVGGGLGDTLTGNALTNTLEGGAGSDTLIGGAGGDIYMFDADTALGTDTIDESGGGFDTLNFTATTVQPIVASLATTGLQVVNSNLSLLLSGTTAVDAIYGGGQNDVLTGNTLANVLFGGPGDDLLVGGAGNEVYLFDTDVAQGVDTIDESGGGFDTLDFSNTTTKAINVNLATATSQVVNSSLNLILSSATTVEGIVGGALGDTLIGNTVANRFNGGGGDDLLRGGSGDDTYIFDTDLLLGTDTIDESGGGNDTLDFSPSTSRGVVVNLGLTTVQTINAGLKLITGGATPTIENAIGSALADTLVGNALDNIFNGGGGNDALVALAGNDTYVFDADTPLGVDTINESGGGIDTLDYSLTTTQSVAVNLSTATTQVVNVNHSLVLSSATTIENAIGGTLADVLTGNTLDNALTGNAGSDTLRGGAGNDVYLFDTDSSLGTDTIDEAGGGEDTLDFSATTTRSVAVDLGVAASQVVNAGLSLVLGSAASVENVIGGGLGDTLRGNTLNNKLTGLAGDDTLVGLSGNDTYLFDSDVQLGTDTIDEAAGGLDTLNFSATSTQALSVNLGLATSQTVNANLKLVLSSAATIENAIGGSLADTILGNGLENTLDGAGGDDTLEGLAGNDKLIGGLGNDVYRFDADVASGTDTIDESAGGSDTLDFTNTAAATAINLSVATSQVVNASLSLILSATNTLENVIGGSGNDTITGNSANNILSGRGGTDTIVGGDGRDLMIGGAAVDSINGGVGEDILIGGTSTHEANIIALRSIMAEWSRTDQTYAQRIAHLSTASGGLNGSTLLNATSIANDTNAADQLTGGVDNDWFFASVGDNTVDIVLASETKTTI